jgi:hypothetical protein
MKLLPPDEKTLFESPGDGLVLTTHRVRYEVRAGGSSTLISIMLDEVASCGVARVQQIVLLAIAAISLIGGVLVSMTSNGAGVPFVVGLVIALVLVGVFFGSREQVLVIASAGATIRANVIDMDPDIVSDFVDQLEFAKNARYLASRAG